MPSSCFITFDNNPARVYYAGQTVSGKVNLSTDRVKTIRGIYITIRGYAEVRWTETTHTTDARGKRRTTSTRYYARDDYFNSRVDVMRSPDGDRLDLMPGRYEYNYQIVLPSQLPSSFNGQYGVVKYEVRCTVDRPWKFNNVFKHPFTVISPLDLNLNPMYRQPVERQGTKTVSRFCGCGNGGEIFVKANIPCGGFVPGQSIPVFIFIKNLSRTSCYETNACLMQMVEYRSYTPFPKGKFELKPVTLNLFGPLEKYQEKELACNLHIPAIAPTSNRSCNIIETTYYVEIQLKTRGLHTNMNVMLPVTIGTIPCYYNRDMPSQDIPSVAPSAPALDAPPAYEEAVKLGPVYVDSGEEDKHIQQDDFLPRYPVYNYSGYPTSPPNEEPPAITSQLVEAVKEKY